MLNQKFRRQNSIGQYVVDFYCPNLKLAIEIDGETHLTSDEPEYDRIRQEEIELLSIEFHRFTNIEICEKIEYVANEINDKIISLINYKN